MQERAITVTYFVLRIVAAFLFIQVGGMKLFGWFGGMPPGAMTTQMMIGGYLEVIGGLALVLGIFTRPIAFLLAGEMAVAYWQFHFKPGTWPHQNGGQPAVLFCFIYLYMAAKGGGDWSLDALLAKKRQTS